MQNGESVQKSNQDRLRECVDDEVEEFLEVGEDIWEEGRTKGIWTV